MYKDLLWGLISMSVTASLFGFSDFRLEGGDAHFLYMWMPLVGLILCVLALSIRTEGVYDVRGAFARGLIGAACGILLFTALEPIIYAAFVKGTGWQKEVVYLSTAFFGVLCAIVVSEIGQAKERKKKRFGG